MIIDKKLNIACGQLVLMALTKLNPNTIVINCDIDDEGFYVDFIYNDKFTSDELKLVEKSLKKLIASGSKIEIEKFDNNYQLNKFQKFIVDENKNNINIININNQFKNIIVSDQIADNVNKIKFFELTNLGGVYWQNNVKNEQLTRIYGSAFNNKDEYEEWKLFIEDKKNRDHRKIGSEMEIFTFENIIGQGLPIWLPNGEIIKNEIKKVLIKKFSEENFNFLDTPVLGSKQLYITSGHWEHYKENNFPPIKIDNEEFILRPMTCPHHMIVYKQKPHSYRELPLYYCENAKLHRYESSGGLIGLERVRAMELFDSHIFCQANQIEDVIFKLDKILKEVHKELQIKIDQVDLSLHDPLDKEKYHNDPQMWQKSESQLKNILKKLNYNACEITGEAAFYGPKIDYQVKTNLGKMITISTIQLDFLLPNRFELEYIDENNNKITPVLVHFGVIGTYERFIATLLSQTKGILPFKLVPVQCSIFPVNNAMHLNYSDEIYKLLKQNNFRVDLDDSNERLSKKVRNAQIKKIPFQVIIGDNEVANKTISYRKYGETDTHSISINEFVEMLKTIK